MIVICIEIRYKIIINEEKYYRNNDVENLIYNKSHTKVIDDDGKIKRDRFINLS